MEKTADFCTGSSLQYAAGLDKSIWTASRGNDKLVEISDNRRKNYTGKKELVC